MSDALKLSKEAMEVMARAKEVGLVGGVIAASSVGWPGGGMLLLTLDEGEVKAGDELYVATIAWPVRVSFAVRRKEHDAVLHRLMPQRDADDALVDILKAKKAADAGMN